MKGTGVPKTAILKVRKHWKNNHKFYIGAGGGMVLAGITYTIMRGRYEALAVGGAYGLKTADTSVTMRTLSIFSDQNNVVNVLTREGRGHPGYIIRSLDTDQIFFSQRDAASFFDISETLLSKHLSGKITDAKGLRFERICMAA